MGFSSVTPPLGMRSWMIAMRSVSISRRASSNGLLNMLSSAESSVVVFVVLSILLVIVVLFASNL